MNESATREGGRQTEVVGKGAHLPWFKDPERAIRSVRRFLMEAASSA